MFHIFAIVLMYEKTKNIPWVNQLRDHVFDTHYKLNTVSFYNEAKIISENSLTL